MRRQNDSTEPIQPIGAVRSASLRPHLPNAQENNATSLEADTPAGGGAAAGAATGAAADEKAAKRFEETESDAPVSAALQQANLEIAFVRDDRTEEMIAQLKDSKTGEVIRQMPPEEMLKIAEAIDKYLGLLIDKKS